MPVFFSIALVLLFTVTSFESSAAERAALFPIQDKQILMRNAEPQSLPYWVTNIPENAFVGISGFSRSIEESRQQAMNSAIGQILQAMGADYQLTHESVLSGNLDQSRHELKERLAYTARWLLDSVQQNARQYAFQETGDGIIAYVLVQMMPWELERLKKLTMGAKLTAQITERSGDHVCVEVRELNGVRVTLTDFRMTVSAVHKNARLITLFFWKVPESDVLSHEGALPRSLLLKNSTDKAMIGIHADQIGLRTVLMGTRRDFSIEISGYDEVGRPVSVPVRSP
jgi:hypothetical protein